MPVLATNKKAFYLYNILETYEAGIRLRGWEVKSIRNRRVSLKDSYVKIIKGEVYLVNAYIAPYKKASGQPVETRRTRKLLLKKETISSLEGKKSRKNLTIVPLKVYTSGSRIKVKIALVKAKKRFQKRREEKKEAVERRIEQALRETLTGKEY